MITDHTDEALADEVRPQTQETPAAPTVGVELTLSTTAQTASTAAQGQDGFPTANEVRLCLLRQRHRDRQAAQLRQRLADAVTEFNECEHATAAERLQGVHRLAELRNALAAAEGRTVPQGGKAKR